MLTPKTSYDTKTRVVSVDQLIAMCDHASGVAHKFYVVMEHSNKIWIGYNNPDDQLNDDPVSVAFPIYRLGVKSLTGQRVRVVVLDIVDARNDPRQEAFDMFAPLIECPRLWYGFDGVWKAAPESKKAPGG